MKKQLATTKHFRISQILSEQIKYMAPGDPLPTVASLMSEHSASQATITQAIERLRRQGLVDRPLGRKRLVVASQTEITLCRIAFIRPSWPSPDYDRLLYAVQEAAVKRHWGVDIICYSSIHTLNISRALGPNDAAVFVPSIEPLSDRVQAAMQSSKKPIVYLRERSLISKLRSVYIDDTRIGELATEHLLSLGHRDILAVTSEPPCAFTNRRLAGWRQALQTAKVGNISSLLVDCSAQPGTRATKTAYEKFSQWLDRSNRRPFTAIFCVDWTGVLGVARALREHRLRVPEDVSVVTFSGEEDWSEYFNPPLTTVEINLNEFAEKALEQIDNALSDSPSVRSMAVKIKPLLEVRKSTRKL